METDLYVVYKLLRGRFGFLDWWPGDTQFEIFTGAILTQQTSWKNVEKALANMKAHGCMDLDSVSGMKLDKLERIIRPSGYYKQKARRLRSICIFVKREYGSLNKLFKLDFGELRQILLSLNGIGNETADSILLYAANKPTFVIDAYTRRALHRIDPSVDEEIGYEVLKAIFEARIRRDLTLYKDFHAQFVELGKNFCKKRDPICSECPLNGICDFGRKKLGVIL